MPYTIRQTFAQTPIPVEEDDEEQQQNPQRAEQKKIEIIVKT